MSAGILAVAATASASSHDLPAGIVSEPTMVASAIRWVTIVWALALLLFGVRMERATIATLGLVVGAGWGWSIAAHQSVALALACALLVAAAGLAADVWVPRLAMAFAMAWPLPALYLVHLWSSGSFDRSRPVAAALLALGASIGAAAPRRSVPLLAAATGTAALATVGAIGRSTAWVLAVVIGSVAWQAALSRARRRRQQVDDDDRPGRTKVQRWIRSVARAGSAAVAVLLWVALAAPMYDLRSVPDPARLEWLARQGELSRPGLVTSAPDNLYLSGRPLPVAIVAERSGPLTRLWLPLAGRSLKDAVHARRSVKDDSELDAMRRAAHITSLAFGDVRPLIRPGVPEAAIERRVAQSFAEHGASGVAFRSIVGSGANAVLPHYDANRAVMNEGLVVIDIGCSVDDYASDMTRTFSVTGEYSDAQKNLIETVIAAGDAARDVLGPGVSMREVDAAARDVIDAAGFGRFFKHAVGHSVGLQVHDPRRDPLEPGMVVTIEPGVYIPRGADVEADYWNLGVRIEDSYIITETGWEEITDYPRRPYAR